MANYYNLDGIQTELRKQINRKQACLEAWENVSFPTKKDGTPFKIMSKNICGATYYMESYAMQPGEYMLRVNAWADMCGYTSSEIRAYELVRYLKDERKIAKKENYQEKQTYLEQVYTYDLDDIKEEVAKKIASLKTEIAQLENQLSISGDVYDVFNNAFGSAVSALASASGKDVNSTLYYMIVDTVKARCF